ncbi:MAG: hypothetical protein OHK0029_00970 [Armatimonadaceae bacterium]
MQFLASVVWAGVWFALLWAVIAVVQLVVGSQWRRRAQARAFDQMVDRYRRSYLHQEIRQ